MSDTTPQPSGLSSDRADRAAGTEVEGGRWNDVRVFATGLASVNVVLILVFALYPKMLTAMGDSLAYVATAGNIIHHGKFYMPFPSANYPVGFSVVLAPANAFQSNFWRFFFMYTTQLVFVNACAIAVYRSLQGREDNRRVAWAALAVVMTPGLVSELIPRVFSETVFTASIVLAFLFLARAVERDSAIDWFLASVATFFSCTVRVIGIGVVMSLIVVVMADLVFRGRKSVGILIPALIGALVGLGPLLAQRLSAWIHEPSVFIEHYRTMIPSYLEWMGAAFTTKDGFAMLVNAAWWQTSMLVFLSLGAAVVFFTYSGRLVEGGWAGIRANRQFVEPYLFVAIFALFALAQAIVHGYGYVLDPNRADVQMRYLLPPSALLLVASVFFTEKHPESARVFRTHRGVILTLVVILSGVLVTTFPLERLRGYRLHSLDYVAELIGFPMPPVSLLAILFPAVFFFAWCRGKPGYLLLFVASSLLFFGSFLRFSAARIQNGPAIERRELRLVADLYRHSVFEQSDISSIWLLHPGTGSGGYFELHSKVFYKKDYHYHVGTYEEFFEVPSAVRGRTIVFARRGDEIDCRRLATGSEQTLWVCP